MRNATFTLQNAWHRTRTSFASVYGQLRTVLVVMLAGILLALPFLWPFLWPCFFVAGLLTLKLIRDAASPWRAALRALEIFFLKYLLVMCWLWSVYPIEWVASENTIWQIPAIGFWWSVTALTLASGGAVSGVALWYLSRYCQRRPVVFIVAGTVVWLVSGVLGSLIFSIVTIGPGISPNVFFSFGYPGYILAHVPLVSTLAGWGGVYALGGFAVALVLYTFVLLQDVDRTFRKKIYALGVGLLLLPFLAAFIPATNSSDAATFSGTVAIVDLRLPSELLQTEAGRVEKSNVVSEAVTEALAQNPDYIILPEAASFSQSFDARSPTQAQSVLRFAYDNPQTRILDSERFDTATGDTVLRATFFDQVAGTHYQFDKQYLVPHGEFTPYVSSFLIPQLGFGDALETLAETRSYVPGPLKARSDIPATVPGVLFCFESVHPLAAWQQTRTRDMPFLAHPIAHSWFHQPDFLWPQLTAMLTTQARFSGTPIVSAGNMTKGQVYLPDGRHVHPPEVARGERYSVSLVDFAAF